MLGLINAAFLLGSTIWPHYWRGGEQRVAQLQVKAKS
jgi:hypothetical protein